MKSPKKKTVEKNKKTKKKKIKRTPRGAGRSFFGGKQGCRLICFVFLAKCIAEKKKRFKIALKSILGFLS